MKNLQTLFIILAAALFFTACQKEETPETFDSISGILTAGEDVSAEDLSSITVILAKLQDGIDPESVTSETAEISFVEETPLNTNGSFNFENLENGNYRITLSDDFTFVNKNFVLATIDGKTSTKINQTVNRITVENK